MSGGTVMPMWTRDLQTKTRGQHEDCTGYHVYGIRHPMETSALMQVCRRKLLLTKKKCPDFLGYCIDLAMKYFVLQNLPLKDNDARETESALLWPLQST